MQFLKLSKYNISKISVVFLFSIVLIMGVKTNVLAQKKYTIVLDAGHGGKDPGNLGSKGSGYKEKKIALRVALDVGKELLTAKDINVIYTRKKDVFVELHNRAKIANDKKADLFVSIHCDSHTSQAHGAGTFVLGLSGNKENLEIARKENAAILYEDNYKQNYDYDPNSPESVIGLSVLQEENLDNSLGIAGFIQNNFSGLRRLDRKVKQANFLVLRETVMPSVLVELGFLTNKAEGKFLNTRAGQIKMAKAIAKAIKKYVERLKLNRINDEIAKEIAEVRKIKKENTTPVKKEIPKKKVEKKVEKKIIGPPVKKVIKKTVKVVTKKVPPVKTGIVTFKIQIAASKKYLDESNFNFKGLKNVETMFIDEYYKYFYGKSSSFIKIKKTLKEVRALGYKGAWVVAFKDGQKITIKEALKKQ